MTVMESIAVASVVVTLVAGGGAGLALVVAIARDPGRPVTPVLEPVQLAPARDRGLVYAQRPPCPVCKARHCAGCTEPARTISTARNHVARHDFEEVPPSLRWLADQVHVTFRGALVASQLVGRHVWRPADRTAFELWASHKLGRPLQLGTARRVMLP